MLNPQNDTTALLDPKPQCLMLEYTSRCNLRCKYCTKSLPANDQSPGRDQDMSPAILNNTLDLIEQTQIPEVLLAGTGESTFHLNWIYDAPVMIDKIKRTVPQCFIFLNSNFSSRLNDRDLNVLSLLDRIVISIDTLDRRITKETRAKSDVDVILANIIRLQGHCSAGGKKMPVLTVNVTLHEKAVHGLYELCRTLSHLPVHAVMISDMIEFEPLVRHHGMRRVGLNNREAFEEFVSEIKKINDWGASLEMPLVHFQPSLLQRISDLFHGQNSASPMPQMAGSNGMTRLCLQPWSRFTIAANGDIFPCCVTEMPPVGRVDGGVREGLNGKRVRDFRRRLLEGRVPAVCQQCTNAPFGSTADLAASIVAL